MVLMPFLTPVCRKEGDTLLGDQVMRVLLL